MEKKLNFQQRELTKHAPIGQLRDLIEPVPTYSSQKISIWLPTGDTQTCKIGMLHKDGVSLDDDVTLLPFASLCRKYVSQTSLYKYVRIHPTLFL